MPILRSMRVTLAVAIFAGRTKQLVDSPAAEISVTCTSSRHSSLVLVTMVSQTIRHPSVLVCRHFTPQNADVMAAEYIRRLLVAPKQSFFLFGPRCSGKSTWVRVAFPDAARAGEVGSAASRASQEGCSVNVRWIIVLAGSR